MNIQFNFFYSLLENINKHARLFFFRNRTKNKYAKLKQDIEKTGRNDDPITDLDALESRIIKIIGNRSVMGDPGNEFPRQPLHRIVILTTSQNLESYFS